MREQLVNRDLAIARIAARQHGVVTTAQLRAAGLDKSAVARRVAAGRLHRMHRGVYAVGHRGLTRRGQFKAAILACGEGTVLSHRSAAELWEMLEDAGGVIHVTVPRSAGRARRAGIIIHRRRSLASRRATSRENIAVTRPADTLVDLRRHVSPGELRNAVRQAEIRGLPIGDFTVIPDRTTSDLELDFLRLCRRARIPEPEVSAWIGRDRVDFLWRTERLIVETDSYRYHRGRVAFEGDRAKDNRLMARGFDVLRFTYWRVLNDAEDVARTVKARLALAISR
jgi:very-short-patch-repair endonuclease